MTPLPLTPSAGSRFGPQGAAMVGTALGGAVSGLVRPSAGSGSVAAPQTTAVIQAQQLLAKASSMVDADKAAHSPGCVACDQKLVNQAQNALSQAVAAASNAGGLNILA